MKEKDILMLCTDGLHAQVTPETMHTILFGSTTTEEEAKSLVKVALDAGGEDDITVIIAAFKKSIGRSS